MINTVNNACRFLDHRSTGSTPEPGPLFDVFLDTRGAESEAERSHHVAVAIRVVVVATVVSVAVERGWRVSAPRLLDVVKRPVEVC